MTPETRIKFLDLLPGESLTIPWSQIPPDWSRPKAGATVGVIGRVFQFEPKPDGLEVTRIK